MRIGAIISLATAALLCAGVFAQDAAPPALASEALTLLETHCYRCHGQDARKGGLSLNSTASIREGGNSGPAIETTAPAESLLLEMISYKDEEDGMPPKGKLDDAVLAVLTRWIMEGAPLPEVVEATAAGPAPLLHGLDYGDEALWAFRPLERPPVPETQDPEWGSNPIDAFVRARLGEAGLSPAPVAAKPELVKRLYYDLTGLPPTPEAVAAFVDDPAPDAYEKLVDALLASKHYGEKWGRHWLDLVHYADSNGYERDSNKPFIWRYRDYVIQSFNEDKPYDQFVREQLAGDELDAPSPASRTATGFYRLGLWDDEPADPLQARYDNLDDIADTASKVFLGLTMGCARCHDHKIDPITQQDYYRFLAFFEGVETMKRSKGNGVLRSVMTPAEEAVYSEEMRAHAAEETRLNDALRELLAAFRAGLLEKYPDFEEEHAVHVPDLFDLRYQFFRDTWDTLPDFDELRAEDAGEIAHGFVSTASATRVRAVGFRFEGMLRVPATGNYVFDIETRDGVRLTVGDEIAYDAPGLGMHAETVRVELPEGALPFRLDYFTQKGPPLLRVSWSGPGMKKRPLSVQAEATSKPLTKLFRQYSAEILGKEKAAEYKRIGVALAAHTRQEPVGKFAMLVTEAGPDAPPTHILLRGNPHTKGKAVVPGYPGIFRNEAPPTDSPYKNAQSSGRRRQLAEWITSAENPLTARVMVNRLWQYHFGRGIVRSSNNFGVLGRRPTHPELLDWLAAELLALEWRLKPMHKLMVMSRTYRMSSRGHAEGLAQDPANNLYWRFDLRRLTAEELRDALLQASGTLNTTMFGPGIFPKLPDEVLATSSKQKNLAASGMWGVSTPEEAARRSIYIQAKRSLREPLLADFDLADSDSSCPVRFSTTLPTQALGMLNSEFVNEQASLLAARVTSERGGGIDARVARAFEIATCRPAETADVERGLRFINEMRDLGSLSEAGAFERFCLLVLNLNEFMYID